MAGPVGSGPDRGRTRLSDADREQLADLLAHHQAAGRFDIDELERRVEIVYAAQWREQLADVLADLPPLAAGHGPTPRRASWGRGHAEADKPGTGWMPTDERFRDPRTRRVMRVWVDPATGSRHYVPDETG